MMQRFAKITKGTLYVIDVDERNTPTQEWRDVFYSFTTLKQVANHIIWNLEKGFKFVEGVGEEGEYNDEYPYGGGFKVILKTKVNRA